MEHVKFVYISVFTHLKKKYRRYRNLFCHRGYTPDTRTTNICSSEIFRKQSTTMTSEQVTICLDSSSHAFKALRPTPLTLTVPKKSSKSEAAMSDQTDSGKTPQKEISSLLHFSILRKRSRLWVRNNSPTHPTEELPLFLVHPIWREGQIPKIDPHPLKIGWLRIRSLAPSAPASNRLRRRPVTMTDVLWQTRHND